MTMRDIVLLEFDPSHQDMEKDHLLRDGLSAVLQIGETLWVANDETVSLERLSLIEGQQHGPVQYGQQHTAFSLHDYLQLPVPPPPETAKLEEADVEGLAYDDGYLWLVGSHSLKRKKPDLHDGDKKARQQLATVSRDGNRYLLARIPVVAHDSTYTLARKAERNGKTRTAAQLRGDAMGNDLTEALREDTHLAPFLALPGKDNGFDIEGLAVAGEHLFIGLRGPVLRGWAVILEVDVKEDPHNPACLRLKDVGSHHRLYRKHFLQLGGLGIRDLCTQGSDLLILAGPTMDLDGPVSVFRWPGGAALDGEEMVPASVLNHVLEVPYGRGVDHAEGMTLFSPNGDAARSLLVVYDSASERRQVGKNSVEADIFPLPGMSGRGGAPAPSDVTAGKGFQLA